ncbi:Thymidylate synthase ThyX [hydrothermal vent metagenome]|uniref:Thymidylate synthase ThyX n=1 Tax=hydrothermal vent metagenome TaxID=652676 RepID=A0A3B1E1M9_9ZZZZ
MSDTSIEPKPAATTTPPIDRQLPDTPLVDVMAGALRHQLPVLDHGFIALVDVMPRLVPAPAAGSSPTADSAIVQAARVSYGQGTKKTSEDRSLIRYLLRHRHTTPFEMVEFKFHVAMPIFVARQWIRHRTANVNEYSARYSILPDRFYRPTLDEVRKQSRANNQGGDERFKTDEAAEVSTAQEFLDYLADVETLYPRYEKLTEKGVSRELARMGLPVSIYTEWYWKCDLHNILRFLSLRMDSHAQEEIQAYARAMHDLIEPIVPITMEAWRDYAFESMHLTRLEVEAIRSLESGSDGSLATKNRREQAEWDTKRAKLGL